MFNFLALCWIWDSWLIGFFDSAKTNGELPISKAYKYFHK